MGWTISTDEPQQLLTALYVRDVAGLRPQVEPEIPPLVPTVDVADELPLEANSAASAQWALWWRRYLDGGGPWPAGKERPDAKELGLDPDFQRQHYWWMEYKPPEFAALVDQPELHSLLRKHYRAGWSWSEAQRKEFHELVEPPRRGNPEVELIQELEQRLGHQSRSFALDVRVLPLDGIHGWRLTPNRVLVSRELFVDVAAYRDWIRPVIEELATVDDPRTAAPKLGSRMRDEHTVRVDLTPTERELVFRYTRERQGLPDEVWEQLLTAHGYSNRSECRLYWMRKTAEDEAAWLMCKPKNGAKRASDV